MLNTDETGKQKWEKRAPAKTNMVLRSIGQLTGYLESDTYEPNEEQAGYIAAAISEALRDYKKAVKKRFTAKPEVKEEDTGFSFEKYAKKAKGKK